MAYVWVISVPNYVPCSDSTCDGHKDQQVSKPVPCAAECEHGHSGFRQTKCHVSIRSASGGGSMEGPYLLRILFAKVGIASATHGRAACNKLYAASVSVQVRELKRGTVGGA